MIFTTGTGKICALLVCREKQTDHKLCNIAEHVRVKHNRLITNAFWTGYRVTDETQKNTWHYYLPSKPDPREWLINRLTNPIHEFIDQYCSYSLSVCPGF